MVLFYNLIVDGGLTMLNRISILKDKMLSQPRFVSIEQALIIARTYQRNEDKSIPYKRALSLYNALDK